MGKLQPIGRPVHDQALGLSFLLTGQDTPNASRAAIFHDHKDITSRLPEKPADLSDRHRACANHGQQPLTATYRVCGIPTKLPETLIERFHHELARIFLAPALTRCIDHANIQHFTSASLDPTTSMRRVLLALGHGCYL
jgi:hypothetical protein